LVQKGSIVPGKDADLVAVTMTKGHISRHDMYTKVPATARIYDGQAVPGAVRWTMVRGTVVYDEGQFLVDGRHGEVVKPQRV